LSAYRKGIFPWYSGEQPILWWSPHPRCVLMPDELNVRRSLKKNMRNKDLFFSMNQAFKKVMSACAGPRRDGVGTWITPEMKEAYLKLHKLGYAHSAEVWENGMVVGGLYGLAIGKVFFGESMFSRRADASKVALACLSKRLKSAGFRIIDCQVSSSHLHSLGAKDIQRSDFIDLLNLYTPESTQPFIWNYPQVRVNDFYFEQA
ncbi:MAG: leucyl/phenylalanyl-tRNA--protein transferase, partial [Gammaproteobacteria bacterium]